MFGLGYILGFTTGKISNNSSSYTPLEPSEKTIDRKEKIKKYLTIHPASTAKEIALALNEETREVAGTLTAMMMKGETYWKQVVDEDGKYRHRYYLV